MLSLNSFSQIDTTRISLQSNIARLAAKDLIRYDGCVQELKLTQEKVIKLESREAQKDTIIKLYSEKDENSEYIIHQKDLQINQYEKLTDDLTKEVRSKRRSTLFWKVTTGLGIFSSVYLLLR